MKAMLLILLSLLSFPALADGDIYTLGVDSHAFSWQPPTERTDGAPFDAATQTSGYTLTIATDADFTNTVKAYQLDAVQVSYTPDFMELGAGQFYAQVTITDTGGRTSAPSNTLAFVLQESTADPKPPILSLLAPVLQGQDLSFYSVDGFGESMQRPNAENGADFLACGDNERPALPPVGDVYPMWV